MGNKIYPIGIQNFESLRLDGYFYIDKTALIYQLVKSGRYYFLSRPRRFGKSVLVDTLEAYFMGKKELFEGWKKPAYLHSGSLFPREKGTFSRTGYGKTGKGLDKISHTAH